MAQRSKKRGLYQRGDYWLDWDRRNDGSFRSPHLAIFWYDATRGRYRSASTRTADVASARAALDRHYLQHAEGEDICPTCGQRRGGGSDQLLLRVITDYLAIQEERTAIKAIRPRLNHVVRYVTDLAAPDLRCGRVDENWITGFRTWLAKRPVVLTSGKKRVEPRSLSSIENSVIQLAAAINAAHKRGDNSRPAQFKPVPTKELNRTPQRRLTIDELADAFSYATDPQYPTKRLGLHRYLMLTVGTAARPDAVHDFSTSPERRQWNSERRIVALNPAGRRQTKKRRAVVVAPRQLAQRIDDVEGDFVPFASIKSAWETMVEKLGWPKDGEGGMKLVRRSIAQLLRDAGTPRAWSPKWRKPSKKVPNEQIEVQLGHRVIDSVTDLYSAFDPDYQHEATLALEAIIDAIIERCPAAYSIPPTSSEALRRRVPSAQFYRGNQT
ncbi:MAG: hypothetical protein ABIQ43_00425 [Sphingomonas sp.]